VNKTLVVFLLRGYIDNGLKYDIMKRNHPHDSENGMILLMVVLINVIILKQAYIVNVNWYWLLALTIPMLIIAINERRKIKII